MLFFVLQYCIKPTRYLIVTAAIREFYFSMCKYSGAIVTISDIVCGSHGYRYKISEDNHEWNWVDGMFEGLASKVENKKNIKDLSLLELNEIKQTQPELFNKLVKTSYN